MTQEVQRANQENRRAWNTNAAFWDERMGEGTDFVEVLVWPATERLLQLRAGEQVLDVACGNGLTSRRLSALGATVVGIDFSEEMIACARRRSAQCAERIHYLVLDATNEAGLRALGAQRFDAALCSMALFDMAEIKPLISALTSLLRPGGRFVFSVLHPCFNSSRIAQVAEQEDREGEIVTLYSVKVMEYITPRIARGVAMRGQPVPQLYFHRPLQVLLGTAFEAGFVLDALEEPAFPATHDAGKGYLAWGGNFCEIPPVMVMRVLCPSAVS